MHPWSFLNNILVCQNKSPDIIYSKNNMHNHFMNQLLNFIQIVLLSFVAGQLVIHHNIYRSYLFNYNVDCPITFE